MNRFCLIDFETSSSCGLKKAGAWRYAEDTRPHQRDKMMSFINTVYRVYHWLGSKDLIQNEPEISISFRRAEEFFAAAEIIREEISATCLLRPEALNIERKFGRYVCAFKLFGLRVKLQTEA